MSVLDITSSVLESAEVNVQQGGDGPIQMLNLLRYRPQATYPQPSCHGGCTGREAYFQRYLPAFNKAAGGEDVQVLFVGNVHAALVAPEGEAWDDVALIQYPSFAAFRRIVESDEYKANADRHRRAALQDWRLLAATRMEMP